MAYTDANFLIERLGDIPRPIACCIIAWSGRGAGENAIREPAHVSLILLQDDWSWCMTDLTLPRAGVATINITNWRPDGLPTAAGIFRGWDLGIGVGGRAHLNAALNEARTIQAQFAANDVPYSELSNRRTDSWNCARYAERILRAAGLSVSAGFFVSTPLELTTGRSRLVRWIFELRRSSRNPTPWYINNPR
jgi:hypothetical protein